MVGEGGVRNAQFALDIADHQAVRVSGQEKLHDSQPWFRSHRREHVGILGDLFGRFPVLGSGHISNLAEIWKLSRGAAIRTPYFVAFGSSAGLNYFVCVGPKTNIRITTASFTARSK